MTKTHVRLCAGPYEADIETVGATLRSLKFRGRDLVLPFDADEVRPAMSGALLAPWPNRLANGAFDHGGIRHQLPINEIVLNNAAHGLVAWEDFTLVSSSEVDALVDFTLNRQPGYPWKMHVSAEYSLTADGLRHEITLTNRDVAAAPVGFGSHPYLLAGAPAPDAISHWTFELPAEEIVLIDGRNLPTRTLSISNPDAREYDFRAPRQIGDMVINNAYLCAPSGGNATTMARVTQSGGAGAEIELTGLFRWLQVYTADELPGPGRRSAIALEPMTCPPDAFNSKQDLITLEPGESASAAWVVRAIG